tara:strand:+ start:309 stop:677 length:369 start_codon:yes stop_codon:yes gene_type:complete
MDILCICIGGQNRSHYLAQYLKEQNADYHAESFAAMIPGRQNRIDEAELVITLHETVKTVLSMSNYNLEGKTILELDVEDVSKEHFFGNKPDAQGRDLEEVHEDIRKQIAPHLPLENLLKST